MAVYDLEEQEQLEELKTWWKQYGNLVTTLATIAAVVAVGWQGWNYWQANQAAQAAMIYGAVEKAATQHDAKQTRQLAGELIDKFPRTAYASMAALVSARVQLDGDDAKNAKAQLQWVADNAKDEALRDIARLRLAAVLVDEKAYDDSMKVLAAPASAAFNARFSDLKGDAFAAQGKVAEARSAYQAAIDDLAKQPDLAGQHGAYRALVQVKLDSLSVPSAKASKVESK